MKVKTFGFRWKQPLPGGLQIQDFLSYVQGSSNAVGVGHEIYLSRENVGGEMWWVGVVLRIRDSNNYTALKRNEQGKRVISAETLKDGKLVEPSFLIAHTVTGNGLFTHHHLATSLPTFSFLSEMKFKVFKERALAEELNGVPARSAKARAIRADFKGSLELQQFCHPKDFGDLVKRFDRISKAEWTITHMGSVYTPFHALWSKAKTRKFTMAYDEELATLQEISDAIIGTSGTESVSEIKVSGAIDGSNRDVFLHKDTKQVLGEREYDSIVGQMSLDLDNWRASLASSKIIEWLVSVARDPDVKYEIENQ